MSYLCGFGRSSHVLVVLSLVAVACVAGCKTMFPETGPGQAAILDATQAVLKERYPDSTGYAGRYAQVYSITPIGMEGGSRSRKQISVAVRQNFTGAYEPLVSVTQYFDNSTAPLTGDPNSPLTSSNPVFPGDRWSPLTRLPMEEVAIYRAIMAKVQPTEM